DGGDVWIREQVVRPGNGLAVLPRVPVDQHAAGEEIVRMTPNLSAHLKEGSERWTDWRGEFRRVASEPESLRALKTGKVLALAQHGGLMRTDPLPSSGDRRPRPAVPWGAALSRRGRDSAPRLPAPWFPAPAW